MGEDVAKHEFTREDRTKYRTKVRGCLDVFARMPREARFDFERPMTGLEIEINLIDSNADPAMKNRETLDVIDDPDFVTELGQWNIEINVAPRRLADGGITSFEETVRRSLNSAEEKAREVGAHMVIAGILPTLRTKHIAPDLLSGNPRYALLNEQVLAARGEDLQIAIDGVERLHPTAGSIVPEAACTSTQLHLQVSPEQFPAYWNAAQAIAGIQVAVGANSPFFLGQGALARDPHRAVRTGHGHPRRRVEGAGCAATRVVRRALDQLDLRPVRGERPVLPRVAAGLRRRGPARDAGPG
jgi:hypothetical protein